MITSNYCWKRLTDSDDAAAALCFVAVLVFGLVFVLMTDPRNWQRLLVGWGKFRLWLRNASEEEAAKGA